MRKYPVRTHGIRALLLRILTALAVCVVLFSPIFAVPVSSQSDTIRFENISTEQGLSQSTVNAIIQDRQGFLWFATEGGLNQYDGYQFTVYHHDPDNPSSLSDNLVFSVYEDRDGMLWLGTSAGLDRLDRSSGKFIHYQMDLIGSNSLNFVAVSAITQDHLGTLWVGTEGGGLKALNLTTNQVTEYKHDPGNPQSLSNDYIFSIYVSRGGELWIGTEAGLDQFDAATGFFNHYLTGLLGSQKLDDVPVQAIYEDGQGVMWIGTRKGLVELDRAANRYTLYEHDPNIPESLSSDSIWSLFEDSLGNLWIGTRSGLNQFDKVQHSFIHHTHDPNILYSLSSDYIRAIFEDRSGVLWIGTSDGGLNKFARATHKFDLYTYSPGLPNNLSDNNIWAVYEDQSKNLWIGTFFSGLNILDLNSGKVTIYRNDPSDPTSLSNDEIRAILQDRGGTIWIGTENGGLNQFVPGTGTFLHYRHNPDNPGSLDSDNVFSIYEDHQGRLWIGTDNGGLNLLDRGTGTFTHYQHDDSSPMSLSDNNVRAIYQDHTGALWIGTFGGLNLLNNDGNQFTVYRHDPDDPSSLSHDMVNCIFEDQRETLWIGTFGGGLDRFDRGTHSFTHYTTQNGLPGDMIYGILEDMDGFLWLSTNKGLSKFNPAEGSFRNYDISDGLQGNQFNPGAYFQGQDGQLLFGGTKGLNAFFPQQVKDNPIPPPVVITAFMKYNQTVQTNLSSNEAIQLSYRDDFISFEFAALDYNAPEKNQYAYQLAGIDNDWVYAGTRRYASYANLRGGDYIFQVKAANNDGIWNEQPVTLHIHITPPFWQTWWFLGIIGLLVVSGSLGGYRLRVSSIENRNRELEMQIAEHTRELEQRRKVAESLREIVNKINSNASVDEVLDFIVAQADVLSDTNSVALWLLQSERGPFQVHSIRGKFPQAMLELKMDIDEGMLGLAVKQRRNIYFQDMSQVQYASGPSGIDDKHPVYMTEPNRGTLSRVLEAFKAIMVVPLLTQNGTYGALEFFYPTPREFTQEEITLASAFADQASLAIENAMLRVQSAQAAILSERTRLARELHDSVTQLLYSVTLYAEAAAELLANGEIQTASEHLHELRDTAQEALREMRLLIFELHRPALTQGGLTAALQARLDAVERRGGIHAELVVEGSEQISRQIQVELYSIAHEALNNALKHAHANSVILHLRFGDNEAEMEISDDGVGFESAADEMGGFGIPGMKERSQKIGGNLQIVSAPGKGTRVRVSVPLNPTSHPNQIETGQFPEKIG
jgi:ligand-binding sensor domain-containing protein/signal transduction histidine kinase